MKATKEQMKYAHLQVTMARRKGILVPQPCEVCGATPPQRIHAHHEDYSKPLSVRWLCHSHHLALHRGPRGPHSKVKEGRKSVAIKIRWRKGEMDMVKAVAADMGITASEFIRSMAIARAEAAGF